MCIYIITYAFNINAGTEIHAKPFQPWGWTVFTGVSCLWECLGQRAVSVYFVQKIDLYKCICT